MRLRAILALLAFFILGLALSGCNGFFTDTNNGGGTSARFAYASNFGSANLTPFTVNTSNGVLTSGAAVTAGTNPIWLDTDANGNWLYVANQADNTVSGFRINRTDGTLTSVGTAVATGTTPVRLSVDPGARFVYVGNSGSNDISGYTVNSSTGVLTPLAAVGASGGSVQSVLVDPAGRYVFAPLGGTGSPAKATVQAFSINSSTGVLTSLGSFTHTGCASAVDIAAEPTVHFAYTVDGAGAICAFTISGTGTLSALGSVSYPTGGTPVAIAVNPEFTYLYTANKTGNSISGYKINNDGTLTAIPDSPFTSGSLNGPTGLAFDPSGNFLYVANFNGNNVQIFSISSTDGKLTSAGAAAAGTNPSSVVVTR